MIIALAGRRIDQADAPIPRFPLDGSASVHARLRTLFEEAGATALVSSGACGADLLAMQAAGELGLRRRMVLPFEPAQFRRSSVEDRPGDWGPHFDRIAKEVDAAGDLIVLDHQGSAGAYAATNVAILEEGLRLGQVREGSVLAVVVWDGQERGEEDLTADFARQARARGLHVVEVPTRGDGGDDTAAG